MNTLIRNGQISDDGWQWIDAGEAQLAARLEAGGRFVLPLAAWLAHRASLDPACAGVWLGPDDEPEAVLPWLADIPLIAIRFPVFTDGRGYSWPACCAAAMATRANCGRWATCCATSCISCSAAASMPSSCAPINAPRRRWRPFRIIRGRRSAGADPDGAFARLCR